MHRYVMTFRGFDSDLMNILRKSAISRCCDGSILIAWVANSIGQTTNPIVFPVK